MTIKRGYYDYVIEARDLDQSQQATYAAINNYILRAAGEDADNNGFGVRDLNCDNCSWVLSRIAVEYYRRPHQDERITVRTWVNDVNRLMTTRNMEIRDEAGELITAAVTQWAMIDVARRSAVDIRQHVDYESAVVELPSPIANPARIAKVAPTISVPHRVCYSDIDFNGHVNSMKYMEWMMDMLPLEYVLGLMLERMDINYHHEALFGQVLNVGFEDGANSLFEITNDQGQMVCSASMKWKND